MGIAVVDGFAGERALFHGVTNALPGAHFGRLSVSAPFRGGGCFDRLVPAKETIWQGQWRSSIAFVMVVIALIE